MPIFSNSAEHEGSALAIKAGESDRLYRHDRAVHRAASAFRTVYAGERRSTRSQTAAVACGRQHRRGSAASRRCRQDHPRRERRQRARQESAVLGDRPRAIHRDTWIRMINTYRPDSPIRCRAPKSWRYASIRPVAGDGTRLARRENPICSARGHQITSGQSLSVPFPGDEGRGCRIVGRAESALVDVLGSGRDSANPFLTGKNGRYVKTGRRTRCAAGAAAS